MSAIIVTYSDDVIWRLYFQVLQVVVQHSRLHPVTVINFLLGLYLFSHYLGWM